MTSNVATLGELLVELRAELKQALNPAQATQIEAAHKVRLQRVQRVLWQDFAWPHLRKWWDVPMAAGQRYYDLPPELDLERVERVSVKWAGDYHPVSRGVEPEHYSAYDSDNDERTDPVVRWEARENGQFEVWPMPSADDSQVIRFTGIKKLAPFVESSHFCTLDRDLIVLSAAAELAGSEEDAQRFAARAKRLYDRLKTGGQFGGKRTFNLANEVQTGRWPTPPRVARNG